MIYNLYVNYVDGKRRMVQVEQSGGYFDPAQVLHDERTQGPMPQEYVDAYAEVLAEEQAERDAEQQAKLDAYNSAVTTLLGLGLTQPQIDLLLPRP